MHSGSTGQPQDILAQTLEDNQSRLLRFLTARTRDASLAEDLLQEARIKLIEKAPGKHVADPLPYLYTMLENMVRDHSRSEASRKQRNLDWGDAGEGIAPIRADPDTPEQSALDRDYLTHVLAALDTLPERTKVIFLAFRVEGVGQREIAEQQGISLSAVEKHLQSAYRMIATLRKKLDAGIDQ